MTISESEFLDLGTCQTFEVKTKSWFGAIQCMDYLCDNWSLLSAVLQHALTNISPAARLLILTAKVTRALVSKIASWLISF